MNDDDKFVERMKAASVYTATDVFRLLRIIDRKKAENQQLQEALSDLMDSPVINQNLCLSSYRPEALREWAQKLTAIYGPGFVSAGHQAIDVLQSLANIVEETQKMRLGEQSRLVIIERARLDELVKEEARLARMDDAQSKHRNRMCQLEAENKELRDQIEIMGQQLEDSKAIKEQVYHAVGLPLESGGLLPKLYEMQDRLAKLEAFVEAADTFYEDSAEYLGKYVSSYRGCWELKQRYAKARKALESDEPSEPKTVYPSDMIERLADLEHQQWAHWTRYMLDNLTDENITRWRRQIDIPYKHLSDKEKQSDWEWAEKARAIMYDELSDSVGAVQIAAIKECRGGSPGCPMNQGFHKTDESDEPEVAPRATLHLREAIKTVMRKESAQRMQANHQEVKQTTNTPLLVIQAAKEKREREHKHDRAVAEAVFEGCCKRIGHYLCVSMEKEHVNHRIGADTELQSAREEILQAAIGGER